MNSNSKKATFTLPIDLVIYLQSKENQAAFVADVLKKTKKEEETQMVKKAVCEMKECKELWDELKDWDVTLEDE